MYPVPISLTNCCVRVARISRVAAGVIILKELETRKDSGTSYSQRGKEVAEVLFVFCYSYNMNGYSYMYLRVMLPQAMQAVKELLSAANVLKARERAETARIHRLLSEQQVLPFIPSLPCISWNFFYFPRVYSHSLPDDSKRNHGS